MEADDCGLASARRCRHIHPVTELRKLVLVVLVVVLVVVVVVFVFVQCVFAQVFVPSSPDDGTWRSFDPGQT